MRRLDPAAGHDTEEQGALREALRDALADGLDTDAWTRLDRDMGLSALAVPEAFDGAGATVAEVAVAVEELGRVLAPVPYLSTAVAGAVLAESDSAAAAEALPRLAAGSARAALVLGDGIARDADGRLSGTASHVIEAVGADLLLVRSGAGLYVVPAGDRGVTVTPMETLDETRSQATIVLASAPAEELGTDPARAEQLLQAMLAVECVGAAAHCLETTVEHLRTRVQFGHPIGEFQALKHRCADLAVGVVSASATARAAVRVAVDSPAELPVLAPLAKKYCADVFMRSAAEMIQLHGGIGFTWEHETHRYFKRAKSTQLLFGSPAELRRLVADRAGLH